MRPKPSSMPRIRGAGMGPVLVLNASYEPLNITTWRRAMVMLIKGKAEGLEHDCDQEIRPQTFRPTVIRLRQFVRVPYRQIPLTRRNVFQRDGYACQYCGTTVDCLSIDHVFPRSRGGADLWENVTTACLTCNVRKGSRTPREAGMVLRREPHRPLSTLTFEASRQMRSGRHQEWAKYMIGS